MAVVLSGTCVQEWAAPKTESIVKIRNAIFGTGLWVVAAGAWALSLGAGRGAVVLGAPVDLSFDVQPDPGSDVASSCVTARLVAGDSPVADAKVRVTPLPDMRGHSPAVRVQAAIAVDEPVLTVTLSAGCSGKTTRSYTFLSELPATVARSASPVDVARLSSGATGSAAEAPRVAAQGSAPGPRALASAPAAVPVLPSPSQESAPPPAAAARARAPAARAPAQPPARSAVRPPAKSAPATTQPAHRARLVVEPLDLWMDRPVALRPSSELQLIPSDESSAQRAQAAALWKSLNIQPEDIDRDGGRLKALEAEMAALRAQAIRDRESAAQAQQQLQQALDDRFPATVVYVLGGLLLAALLLVAWTWTRLRSASEKAVRAWRDSVAVMGAREAAAHEEELGLTPHPGDTWVPSETLPTPQDPAVPSVRQPLAPASGAALLVPQFVDTSPVVTGSAPLSAPPAQPPAPATARKPDLHIVSPEELFDIQQQAEFFVSVGEHQQAIQVLKNHIADRGDVSPLAYLELLRLYHTLSRVEEFGQLRKQFMQSFNAQVPEFAVFHRTGRMLYHYTDALAEIEAEWTSPSVLALLERLLFRREGGGTVERFDMAAYDELLLLLAIAQTTPASARGAPPPRRRTTPLAPDRKDAVVMQEPPAAAAAVPAAKAEVPLDSLAASLEFELEELSRHAPAEAEQVPGADTRGASLDLDLSEPPHLTLSDLPPVPVTTPPPAGQAVGFGMNNDLMELRLELEQQEPTKGRRS